MNSALNLVVFISGNGSNLQSIIDAVETGQINAKIRLVVSNNPDAYGITRAANHNIEYKIIDHHQYDDRVSFDQALLETVNQHNPDFIVLAGFMRILGKVFIQAYRNKILNIHPSILPAYKGLNTHQRALDNGENEHGVSIHIVTAELDNGPVLLRGRYPIESGDLVEDLQQKGHSIEHRMYPRLLEWICNCELQINETSIAFRQQPLLEAIEFGDA